VAYKYKKLRDKFIATNCVFYHFPTIVMNINDFFSETEKSNVMIYMNNLNADENTELSRPSSYEVDLMEEQCSELWNKIKDATVLSEPEFSKFSLSRLQFQAEMLSRQVQWYSFHFPTFSTNIQLRLECVFHALSDLKNKRENFESTVDKEDSLASQFRKWLYNQELDLALIRQRVPCSRDSVASLKDLEIEQQFLQEQIQKEGRKFLYSFNVQSAPFQNKLCDSLEQRYLALWLASLECFELILHFKECFDSKNKEKSELEEGPNPKRRKTFKTEGKGLDYVPVITTLQQQQLNQNAFTNVSLTMDDVIRKEEHKFPLGSDIGYSSGENNSVHEANAQSVNDQDQTLWAEQIAQSIELEKSFYRTVPLDDFGMTDLDTDDGEWDNRGNYLTQKFLHNFEEKISESCQGRLELTDSLIVHVDAPEYRPLNDFDEVMDLFGQENLVVNYGRPFSEDDCESLSTVPESEALIRERRKISSRKRALKTPLSFNKNGEKQKEKQRRNFSSGLLAFNSDLEWEEDAFLGYDVPNNDNSFAELPDIVLDECETIREKLQKLKNRFDSDFFNLFMCNVLHDDKPKSSFESAMSCACSASGVDSSTQVCSVTKPTYEDQEPSSEASITTFWRSYLFLCLIGLFTSVAILLYMNSCDGVDWRWSFGPQLHYLNGPPPI
jgi:hypothetical protein